MRVLVCGSRHFNDYEKLKTVLSAHSDTKEIVHGCARGADTLAGRYAKENNLPVHEYPADWDKHGKAAGPIRNTQMLREGTPDMVIAFRGVNSRGTQNMINQAMKAGIETRIYDI